MRDKFYLWSPIVPLIVVLIVSITGLVRSYDSYIKRQESKTWVLYKCTKTAPYVCLDEKDNPTNVVITVTDK